MKKRYCFSVALFILILLSVSVNNANAAALWYDKCTVLSVGTATNGQSLIYLSGGTPVIPTKYYTLGVDAATSNRELAVALTALTMGATVGVAVDVAVGTEPVIQTIVVYPSE